MTIRVVLQSIAKGSILVDNAERYVNVGRGMIVYIAFLDDIDDTALQRAVTTIMTAKVLQRPSLEEKEEGSSQFITSLEEWRDADILVVPQATLGGKLKGRNVQFHSLVNKTRGLELFSRFCQLLREARGIDTNTVDANGSPLETIASVDGSCSASRVINGTYGNRQGLRFESDGPLSHFLDL
ncbi:Chain A, Structural Analysis Of A Probable Eukaryotic D-Amino Acid Trna Deacylase [Trypanosoma theileri]|uniref:Chain A, Structural Analysis Of A Probable Eukaryotic D-Amino Acid Trna Deacylase n=1 Tax=Trypanosoma theileri TaxID=67003 RepID=A0A1X0P9Y0_9TRYP|nr:Chain A, Structural Analysis Of A Probable Eukaryotic D-Amino Acid Trna Deacylase [Trypanosoma theileri]ORC93742.1 Chain A, Structural Analysis Of A Probable Eukaryotic D-Amino Acid Trna Deacylase [Trypanosoma theileri]